jgi:methyl-accepting chemotaxis protein
MWTFGKKIAAGFAVLFLLFVGIGSVAYRSIDMLTQTSYRVAHTQTVLRDVDELISGLRQAETGQRGFIITGEDPYLDPYRRAIIAVPKSFQELRELTADNPHQQRRLAAAEPLVQERLDHLKEGIDVRREAGLEPAAKLIQRGEGKRLMDELNRLTNEIKTEENAILKQRAEEVEAASSGARRTIVGGTLLSLLFVTAVGFGLTRSLANKVTAAVQHVQRSATDLQTAANEQATAARESSTSMTEITATVTELLASARQIAGSAQRVTTVAEESATAAKSGDGTVLQANESITGIRQQVDLVVTHMLELGKKSQQIGSVLDIVSELAEQTNILAINATIEAVGAGDAGRRFSAVADEIRKLADRVASSTKETRTLIDDVRGAVNTTVMATETAWKAVDTGSRQFAEVATTFKQIAALVATTTESAREISLATQQQTTAVEQVNLAIANTAQAARETEASSQQTFQTASRLAALSKELLRLVQHQPAG